MEEESTSNEEKEVELSETEILEELKDAYNSLNSLNKSASHRRILLEIEKKIRKDNKEEK